MGLRSALARPLFRAFRGPPVLRERRRIYQAPLLKAVVAHMISILTWQMFYLSEGTHPPRIQEDPELQPKSRTHQVASSLRCPPAFPCHKRKCVGKRGCSIHPGPPLLLVICVFCPQGVNALRHPPGRHRSCIPSLAMIGNSMRQ